MLRHFLRNLFRRDRVERELSDEIDGFVDLLIEEKVAQGMSPDEARRAARLEIGRVEHVKDNVRDVRAGVWLDALRQDARFGVRTLLRRPGFAAVAVLTLGVGMGATTAIFSLIDSVLLKPLPFHEPDRLAMVWEVRPRFNQARIEAAPLNYLDWEQQVKGFKSLAAYVTTYVNLTGSGTPERLEGMQVTRNLLPTLGIEPLVGRGFTTPEGSPGQTTVAILSYGLWQRRFGGDRAIVGQKIRLDGQPHLVVGVMPRGFQFPREGIQLWTPIDIRAGWGVQSRGTFFLSVVGRLKPNVSVEQANAEIGAVSKTLQTYPENRDATAVAVPLQQDLTRNARTSFLLLLAGAVLVLLIACANVAGLLVTRGAERDREFAVRTALGGSRRQLLRQLIVEGLLLSAGGAVVGLVLATRTFDMLETLVPDSLRGAVAPVLDLRLMTAAFVAVVLTGLVFGLLPLRHALRMDLRTSFTARTTTSAGGRRHAHSALVAAEVALAVVVLFSTALMIRTILNLQAVDPGFRVDHVLTANVQVTADDYPTPERENAFHREVIDRVRGLPGVVSAGFTTFLPYTTRIGAGPIVVEGRRVPGDGSNIAIIRYVTPDFLKTLGVPLLSGRGFSDRDNGSPGVALVSKRVTALFDRDPVGQQIRVAGPPTVTVVGVVGDIKGEGLEVPNTRGTVYLPAAQLGNVGFFSARALAVRTTSNPAALAPAVQREIWGINPNQTIADVRTLETIVDGQISIRKVQTALFSTFSGLALFMAALGVYGLLSFVVTSRTREIGVRTAMGAQRWDLVTFIMRDSSVSVGFGLVGGLVLAVIVSRSMSSLIYGVEPLDVISLTASTGVLGAVAGSAALLRVWRATRIDPMTALRAE
jgi:putative ABC transport system permease protein